MQYMFLFIISETFFYIALGAGGYQPFQHLPICHGDWGGRMVCSSDRECNLKGQHFFSDMVQQIRVVVQGQEVYCWLDSAGEKRGAKKPDHHI